MTRISFSEKVFYKHYKDLLGGIFFSKHTANDLFYEDKYYDM
jgi:hypothetical protein